MADVAVQAALQAGAEILAVYGADLPVELKEDDSPLTLADRRAHGAIERRLAATGIPILSEEGREIPFEERRAWARLWIVDPLDGTKEFLKRNGEFTVNVALVEEGVPVLGVVHAPALGVLYCGAAGWGAWKASVPAGALPRSTGEVLGGARRLPVTERQGGPLRIVASRSHLSAETEAFIREQEAASGAVELVSMGSSLKICMVAEGSADLYPRFAPTMEWDTAAGQAVAEAAGRSFVEHPSGMPMRYNRERLRNGWFLVR